MKQALQDIPVLDLKPEIEELWDEINGAIQRVLRSTEFILGSEVKLFEEEIARYLGVKHGIGLNSGTDALFIALRALEIGSGDEVITTPFSFFATAEAISLVGATPVFVDIDPLSYNINPALIEKAITPKTRAIIPVHLYGNPAAMDQIMELARKHCLKVIEDCAQSFGAKYAGRYTGTIGEVGAFSFFPSKNLGAYGDGGLLTTNNDKIAELARMLRAHGSRKKYHNEMVGYNSRLDTLQAAVLRVKLPYVEGYNLRRRAIAIRYNQLLADVPGIALPNIEEGHVFHQYTVRILNRKRDQIQHHLSTEAIGTMIYYPVPIHKLPVYSAQGMVFPQSDLAATEVLSLPIWPQMPSSTQERVVKALRDALAK